MSGGSSGTRGGRRRRDKEIQKWKMKKGEGKNKQRPTAADSRRGRLQVRGTEPCGPALRRSSGSELLEEAGGRRQEAGDRGRQRTMPIRVLPNNSLPLKIGIVCMITSGLITNRERQARYKGTTEVPRSKQPRPSIYRRKSGDSRSQNSAS
ncbi:hypothetical protein VTI74DRAFT_10120 [Chaetomium olivicolor]